MATVWLALSTDVRRKWRSLGGCRVPEGVPTTTRIATVRTLAAGAGHMGEIAAWSGI